MKTKKRELNVFLLAMINVAAICNLKNFPVTAEYGFSIIFYYAIIGIIFFVPVSLISAELATAWPERGGVYVWVKKALGPKWGFLAIWLQWSNNLFWYPSILSVTAATFAYTFNPALAQDPQYIAIFILVVFWSITALNFLGMKVSGWISTLGVIIGTVIPGALIMVLGFVWILKGNPSQVPINLSTAFPDILSINELGLISGIFLTLAGMEMSAVHAKEVQNPQKNYPRAILLSAIIILFLSVVGSLSIAVVVPQKEISLTSAGMEAFDFFFRQYNISWMLPIIAAMITAGAIGMVSTWIIGPTKGMLAAAQDKDLPEFFSKTNKKDMPVVLLFLQGIIASFLSLIFLFAPTINTSYWLLFNLTALLYLLMYLLMFVSGIVLRYKYPEQKRAYKIPGKNYGMWIVSGMGILGSLFAITFGFLPPTQIDTGSVFYYEAFLVGGITIFCIIPFTLYSIYNKKRS